MECFAVDEEDLAGMDEIQREFAAALAARASAWPIDPNASWLLLPHFVAYGYELGPGETAAGRALAVVDVLDLRITVGVYINGSTMRGDILHNQLFTFLDRPTRLAVTAEGSPTELAERAADWFEGILSRAPGRRGSRSRGRWAGGWGRSRWPGSSGS